MSQAPLSISRRLLGYLAGGGSWRLSAVLVCILGATVLLASGPFLIGRIIDEHIVAQRPDGLAQQCLLLLVIYGLAALFGFVQARLMAGIAQGTAGALRRALFSHVLQLPPALFAQRSSGELISRISLDMDVLAVSLNQGLAQLLSSLVLVLAALLFMFSLSPWLALLTLACLSLMFVTTRYLARRARHHVGRQQQTLSLLTGTLQESIAGLGIIRLFNAHARFRDGFVQANQQLCRDASHAQVLAGIVGPTMNTCNNLGYALIALAGCWMVWGGFATLGLVAAFLSYSRQLERPVSEFANQFSQIQSAWVGVERAFALLDQPAETDAAFAFAAETLAGELQFDQVQFAYRPEQPVLRGVSFTVGRGEHVALAGVTGAGKSTLFNLVLRFIEPTAGRVHLDGRPLGEFERRALRRRIGVVLQEPYLFAASVLDNIRYGRPDASLGQVRHIAELLDIDDFINHLPQGYATVLQAGGQDLSRGQRQLLAIARALLAEPSLLLLDEATSNLDRHSERCVRRALAILMKGRTCLIIAHRLSTVRNADRILLLDQGRVIEQGSHAQLMALDGGYARLWRAGEDHQDRKF